MSASEVFFWQLISFIAGVALASIVPVPLAALGAAVSFGGALLIFGMLSSKVRPRAIFFGWAVFVFSFGAFWLMRENRPPDFSIL